MEKFTGITDAELTAEIERRRKEAEEKARRERLEKNTSIVNALKETGFIDRLEHGRTSCSDTNIANGWGGRDYGPRCSKCALLEFIRDGWIPDDALIELTVTVRDASFNVNKRY